MGTSSNLGSMQRPTRVRFGVLGFACSLSLLTYLDRICIMRAKEDMQHDLGFSNNEMGWIFSAFIIGYALFEVPGGWMGDIWGSRRVITRIVLCWSLFTALTGCVWSFSLGSGSLVLNSLAALLLVRFLFGVGEAGAYPNLTRVVGSWFPFHERAFAQGNIWMCARLGGAFAPYFIGRLSAALGWRQAFWVLGATGIAWCLVFRSWFRDTPEEKPECNAAERDLIRGTTAVPEACEDASLLSTLPKEEHAPSSESIQTESQITGFASRPPQHPPEDLFQEGPSSRNRTADHPATRCVRPRLAAVALPGFQPHGLVHVRGLLFRLLRLVFLPHLATRVSERRVRHQLRGIRATDRGAVFVRRARLANRRQPVGFHRQADRQSSLGPQLDRHRGLHSGGLVRVRHRLRNRSLASSHSVVCGVSGQRPRHSGHLGHLRDVGGRYAGTVAGVMNMAGGVGAILSPILIPRVLTMLPADYSGPERWRIIFSGLAVSWFLGAVAWVFIDASKPLFAGVRGQGSGVS